MRLLYANYIGRVPSCLARSAKFSIFDRDPIGMEEPVEGGTVGTQDA